MAPSPPRKRALLIGIDEYPNLSAFHQLEGCVNDVTAMAGLLRDRFGFADEDVTVLTNAAATRAGILAALDRLADAVEADDVVVVHYAGHGSQITDLDGDEPDGLDETIVPHDGVRQSGPNTDITDDEIHAWIQRVTATTPFLTLLFDCCHSGTVTRDAFGARARSLAPDTRRADQIGRRPGGVPTRSVTAPEGPSGWLPLHDRYVLIAGCRDDESAYEYRPSEADTPHGALTYFLVRALREATPGTTYRDVYDRIRPSVTAHSSKQHPQMEGALDRAVFGVRDLVPMPFVAVAARDGQTVTLGGGAAHGLTVGSEWDVYPAGTKTVAAASALGRLRVTGVEAAESRAEVVEEPRGGSIGLGARAVEVHRGASSPALRVDLGVPDAEARQRVAAEIDRSPVLQAVPEGAPADLRLVRLAPRGAVAEGDAVPQLGPLPEATWAAVGADGRLVCPPHPASRPGVETLMRENLETVARYRIALALDNPVPGPLRGSIDLRVQRLANGTWQDAEPEAGGEVVFEEGERLAFTVTNHHTGDVYVNVLDFGLAGAVSPLTVPGSNEALAPGNTLRVGYPKGIPLGFPATFPFVREPGDAEAVEGTETLKAFVTTRPTDFSALKQGGVRSADPSSGSSLSALLRRTFQGAPTRDLFIDEAEPGDDWTTVMRTFVLRRTSQGAPLGERGLDLGEITIRASGLEGQVRVLPPPRFSARTRSAAPTTGALDAVLAGEHVETLQTVEIQQARVPATRSLGAEPEIRVDVPAVEGHGQLLLATDESGVTTWHVAESQAATRSLGATQTFVIRDARPAPTATVATRGLVGAVGTKLIKRLVFPLIDPVLGAVGAHFAERWEEKRRPYALRPFTPADFRAPAAPLGADDWRRLGEGRSLLFVHGTFSRAHSAFGGLDAETLAALGDRYGGRVFAFDHFTLSHDPEANVRWLVEHLPDDAALDLDVVCHSRGGLVSRVLAEQQSALSLGARSLRVGTVVFVASPNAGTSLADPDHMGTLVDAYTNLLNFIPGSPVTDVLEGVVTVVKQLAVGALGGLDGLQAMRPGGPFLRDLNALNGRGDTRYLALGADYRATQPGLAAWVKNRLMGRIFGSANDLVVPTASVYADTDGDGVDLVAEADRHVFAADAAISHTGFFQHPDAQARLLTWLQA
ncbi:DUF7379 domain-containing protein [Rubrivirga marina]|uniref:Caspase family p20 domain-containing protein n=1 Tax=Rubrivirga marina TaxID=1196024 RepID=A0A271IV88_9BACT|nr:caspase family protein [Rubrivirga marina]PAP75156.1 hypothetical protein BSZ37_01195 [Rubrivirga marina]